MKKRLAILASGTGSNAQNIINYFRDSDFVEVALVICNKPDAGVMHIAAKEQIHHEFIPSDRIKQLDVLNSVLQMHRIEYVILAGFLLKVPADTIHTFEGRMINIHPALLPAYGGKGMYGHFVHEAVHRNRDKESGITIHEVNENYDEGNILFQARVLIEPEDGPADIEKKVRQLEMAHFPRVIEEWLQTVKSAKKSETF